MHRRTASAQYPPHPNSRIRHARGSSASDETPAAPPSAAARLHTRTSARCCPYFVVSRAPRARCSARVFAPSAAGEGLEAERTSQRKPSVGRVGGRPPSEFRREARTARSTGRPPARPHDSSSAWRAISASSSSVNVNHSSSAEASRCLSLACSATASDEASSLI